MTTPLVEPSALSNFIKESCPTSLSESEQVYHQLAVHVLHDLQYQHIWSNLSLHLLSPLTGDPLPRPIISGFPPKRVYVHPDEQIENLDKGVREEDLPSEPEWVLPTQIREKWSLKAFAGVFDAITETPQEPIRSLDERKTSESNSKPRRGGKRILLATVNDDSTIVYYIIHDGIVKPRQN
ncbi:MAG: hypothetical protein M1834_000868 [Cirrosporium novae-zelandiae]|nr:MAG: hypothetical protein M1834_000868 [Cirrosporium novae-zelandiae]